MSINNQELLDLFIEASKLMSSESDRCGNLIYTQKESGKHIIREPEATHIVVQLLTERNIDFGLEVPTKKRYIIDGKKPDSANIDLVINPNDEQINIEFKRGQPYYDKKIDDVKSVRKDFDKLLREQAFGSSFFHILKNTDSRTFPSLQKKYRIAYNNSMRLKDKHSKWFLFFIFVKEKKVCFWQFFKDITNILDDSFKLLDFCVLTCIIISS